MVVDLLLRNIILVMFIGDNNEVVYVVVKELGISDVYV